MIIKRFSTGDDVERLLALAKENPGKKAEIDKQVRNLRAGMKGEKESAHYIDHDYGRSENWAVIHGLRLDYEGRVAQIDHLLINRSLIFVLLETKHSSAGIKVTETGEFLRWFRGSDTKRPVGMASPIEQNKRHAKVLRDVLDNAGFMPKRLGMRMSYDLMELVLVNPDATITRPEKFDTSSVITSDRLSSTLDAHFEKFGVMRTLGRLGSVVSVETLREIAERISFMHVPITIDYAARFGVQLPDEALTTDDGEQGSFAATMSSDPVVADVPKKKLECAKCGVSVEYAVGRFCWQNKARFGGDVYCREHQKDLPPAGKTP